MNILIEDIWTSCRRWFVLTKELSLSSPHFIENGWIFLPVILTTMVLFPFNRTFAILYLINPSIYISSIRCCILHIAWLTLWYRVNTLPFLLALLTATAVKPSTILLAPALIYSHLRATPVSSSTKGAVAGRIFVSITLTAILVLLVYPDKNIPDIIAQYLRDTMNSAVSYQPSFGVVWYLDALTFPEQIPYFRWLKVLLPIVTSTTLVAIFPESWNYECLMQLIIAVGVYFETIVHLGDFTTILIALVCMNTTTVRDMRFVPVLLSLISISLALSPFMYESWIYIGNGNANFLFFQGLVQWVCYTVFLVEFVSSKGRADVKRLSQS